MMLSIIVPTVGRASLEATLRSLVAQPLAQVDEVLVIGGDARDVAPFEVYGARHLPYHPGGHWGCEERTVGIGKATGSHLAFIDDDDIWLPGARETIARAIAQTPDKPMLFRMRYPSGRVLWDNKRVLRGNVSTQMVVVPNIPGRLGRWTTRREGDYDFIRSLRWRPEKIVWREDVIAEIGAER